VKKIQNHCTLISTLLALLDMSVLYEERKKTAAISVLSTAMQDVC
jgi:hypothetical protein